ncbi:MAG: hypothetical protein GC157_14875, partial [Frankiales bacterium]|nr:hypothetical protein [Frankiales bacterium]
MPDGSFSARVDSLLLEMASQEATGCLTLTDPEDDHASVWFRDGLVYAVSVPGRRPLLGVRLMSSGALTPEALAEALEVQRTELQGWRLGELLVHLGFVDRAVVEAFVTEQVRDQVADLLHWDVASRKFRNGKRTRQDVAPPIEVTDLLELARERDERWAEILPYIGGADGVPQLSTASTSAPDVVLGPYDWALLCKVDGVRTIADLADDCGFTVFEAGMVVVGLLDAGLVEMDSHLEGVDDAWQDDDEAPTDDEVAVSVARVAAALHEMNLGPTVGSPFTPRPVPAEPAADDAPEAVQPKATASAPARRSPFTAAPVTEQLADVVSLASERAEREEAERKETERKESERRKAERKEAERQEAERRKAERQEAEREAERAAAALRAAEDEAYAEAATRLAAEIAQAEEDAYAEAEERLAAHLAEIAQAEEDAYAEADERLAAEIAQAEEDAYAEAEERLAAHLAEIAQAEEDAYA